MLKLIVPACLIAFVMTLSLPNSGTVAVSAAPDPAARSEAKPPQAGNGYASVAIERAADGHFYADALVNGAPVRFIVDTGASTIALNRADAQAAGLQFGSGDFTGTGQGVGGALALKRVTLDRVRVGAVEAHGVEGAIIDGDLAVSLLGQSWLRRIGSVSIEGDLMVLR